MSTDTALPPEEEHDDTLRRRLINRIAVAGVVIVALLGGLALIDNFYVAPPPAVTPKISPPPPQEDAKPINAVPVAPLAEAPEPPRPEAVPSIKRTAEPEETRSPSAPLPKQAHPAVSKTAPPQELAHQEPGAAPLHPPPSRPLTQGQAERRFVLQIGVFNNVDNAQELLAKLQQNGVPAQIEARVQVGPFKTRKEADEARIKLAAMGLDPGLLMAIRR